MTVSKDSQDRYSIIISYRDREEHLQKLLPRLQEHFKTSSYEIIIAEQDNSEKFQKNTLYNLAAVRATGNILVFHDVDYYPTSNVNYHTEEDTPYYPVGRVQFLDSNDQPRSPYDIPGGYRNFHINVGDHSGGVFVLSKTLFEKVKGFNPYYKGWGKEDDDTRDRLRLLGYEWKRDINGLFYALYHEDNKPSSNDPDFINNHILLSNLSHYLNKGYESVSGEVEEYKLYDNVRWLKLKNFIYADRD